MSRSQSFSGKGSNQRPHDKKKFDENYDRIFGKKKNPVEVTEKPKVKPIA